MAIGEISPEVVEVAVVPVSTRRFRMLTKEEISKYLEQVK